MDSYSQKTVITIGDASIKNTASCRGILSLDHDERFVFIPLIVALLAFSFHLFSFFSNHSPNEKQMKLFSFSSLSLSENQQNLSGGNQIVLGQKIDINRANIDDFTALPMIGPKLAEKIIEERDRHGRFKNINDLMRVKGIKEKKIEKLSPFITSF